LASENTGLVFLGCKITGAGTTFLGRPWGAYSRVLYAFTYMSGVIAPAGWDDWADPSKHRYMGVLLTHSCQNLTTKY